MHRFLKAAVSLLLCLVLLASVCFAAAEAPAFPDAAGHWASAVLSQAAEDGLLGGFEDGTLRPDAVITQAQILQILARALHWQSASEPAALGLGGGEWYAAAALAAYDRGLIATAAELSAPMDREKSMVLLCRALGLTQERPDAAVLEAFAEDSAPAEVLSLVSRGIVEGVGDSLRLTRAVTRAEFITMLYRALGALGAVAHEKTELRDLSDAGTLWCGADCTELLLHNVQAKELIVCGAPETITLEYGSEVERLRLLFGGSPLVKISGDSRLEELSAEGEGCALRMVGTAEKLVIAAGDFSLDNWYCVKEAVLRSARSVIPDYVWWYKDERDYGLTGLKFSVSATEKLAVNAVLRASAVLNLPDRALGKTVAARWYLGETLLREESVTLSESRQTLRYSGVLEYSRDLPTSAPVRLELCYQGVDGEQVLSSESAPVEIENKGEEYYLQQEQERVLALVDTGYDGDFTVEWAQNHDYTDAVKTVWVNAKGYESDTEYLIWVSIKFQRCNIFRGSKGAWTLVRSSIIATGAPWSETPVGVWKTTYKQEQGWTTATYTVKPVVRFKGGGYAFHSRLFAPNTDILTEPELGYPLSHGCVRMYDEEIWWIFNNIPDNTTVVVF